MLDRALPKVLAAPLVGQPEIIERARVRCHHLILPLERRTARLSTYIFEPRSLRWPVELVHTVILYNTLDIVPHPDDPDKVIRVILSVSIKPYCPCRSLFARVKYEALHV